MSIGSTLIESILHQIIFFEEKGFHLNAKGHTLCSGSRNSYDWSPGVDFFYFNSPVVQVDLYNPDGGSHWNSGIRQTVA